ncbi:MAG: hypothetical protein HUJ72_04640 [Blautia sp.]|nr:hypothetical protein [Blautia sp.]
MSAYDIRYYLYRSNPVILRKIRVPEEYSAGDLACTFCLGMGIPAAEYEMLDDTGQKIPEQKKLSELFGSGEAFTPVSGVCRIYQDRNRLEATSLTFCFDVEKENRDTPKAPAVLSGVGPLLPQNVFHIGNVNEILEALRDKESYTHSSGGTFYKGQQALHLKKLQNLVYAHFIPDQVVVLKTEIAVPIQTVLENRNMNNLRHMAEIHHVYAYENKKAQYISALTHRLSGFKPRDIFQKMNIQEYLHFVELVRTGKVKCSSNEDLEYLFPVLSAYGMISMSRKAGFFLAAPIMQNYEEWFDGEKETEFRMKKRMEAVMIGCGCLYGVFSRTQCKKVLDTLYPGEVSDKVFCTAWDKSVYKTEAMELFLTNEFGCDELYAYDCHLFNEQEEMLYLKAIIADETERKMPEKEYFDRLSRTGMVPLPDAFYELKRCLGTYIYEETILSKRAYEAVLYLRKGYSVEKVEEYVRGYIRHYYWYDTEEKKAKMREALAVIAGEVPHILYYGYTPEEVKANNITSKAEKELVRLIKEQRAEEKRKKEEAEQRKRAADEKRRMSSARKTAAKTTGKRGTGK